jgi:CheY-like chemotaxis protein
MVRILLADDEQAARELVSRALSGEGHDVVVTNDGAEALDHLTAEPAAFHLLISDIHMPGLDGLTLAEKASALSPSLGIILMTGIAPGIDLPAAIRPRVKKLVTKPFTLEQIRQAVREALG